MLRRPHDHHRDLPARRDAAPSANRSNHQDRHFMTAPVPRCRKCARFVRWFSAASDDARPNVRLFCQTAQLPAQFGAPAAHSSPASPPADAPDRSHTQSRGIRGTQIAIVRDEPPRLPSRGFLPWRFSDAGRPCRAAPSVSGRHPKTFTTADLTRSQSHVRFTPESGRRELDSTCPLCAKSGLMQCNKNALSSLIGAHDVKAGWRRVGPT